MSNFEIFHMSFQAALFLGLWGIVSGLALTLVSTIVAHYYYCTPWHVIRSELEHSFIRGLWIIKAALLMIAVVVVIQWVVFSATIILNF